jgi:hypothetical protein
MIVHYVHTSLLYQEYLLWTLDVILNISVACLLSRISQSSLTGHYGGEWQLAARRRHSWSVVVDDVRFQPHGSCSASVCYLPITKDKAGKAPRRSS